MNTRSKEPMASERYAPEIYDALNTFHTAKRLLVSSRRYINCLGDVIVRHKLQDTFGVSLLHKHFDLFASERLVRRTSAETRTVRTGPVANARQRLPAYLWKVRPNSSGEQRLAPLEFLADSEPFKDIRVDGTFLSEFAGLLQSHNVENVFGLATLDILRVPISADEIRVETTDGNRRLLTVVPETRADIDIDELTETFWTFVADDFDIEVVTRCDSHCDAHCKNHCNFHCRNHCRAHCHNHCKSHPSEFDPADRLTNPVDRLGA